MLASDRFERQDNFAAQQSSGENRFSAESRFAHSNRRQRGRPQPDKESTMVLRGILCASQGALSWPTLAQSQSEASTLTAAIDRRNLTRLTSSPVDQDEMADIVAFLQFLTDQVFVTDRHLSLWSPCGA